MTDLYRRILMWHKLVAMQTGGLALCSAKHRLNRDEAKGWSTMLRNVADEIDVFLKDGTFILDERGQRVVHSVALDEKRHEAQEDQREVAPRTGTLSGEATGRKAGGLRVAARRK